MGQFNFEGGKFLSDIGASWFIAYAYYTYVDSNYLVWNSLDKESVASRKSKFFRYIKYHKIWAKNVLYMNENRLKRTQLNILPTDVKTMAQAVFNKLP